MPGTGDRNGDLVEVCGITSLVWLLILSLAMLIVSGESWDRGFSAGQRDAVRNGAAYYESDERGNPVLHWVHK